MSNSLPYSLSCYWSFFYSYDTYLLFLGPLFLCSFVLSCILFRAIDLFSTVTILICFSALCFSIYLFFLVFFFVLLICFHSYDTIPLFFGPLFLCFSGSIPYYFSRYWSVFHNNDVYSLFFRENFSYGLIFFQPQRAKHLLRSTSPQENLKSKICMVFVTRNWAFRFVLTDDCTSFSSASSHFLDTNWQGFVTGMNIISLECWDLAICLQNEWILLDFMGHKRNYMMLQKTTNWWTALNFNGASRFCVIGSKQIVPS